MAASIALCMLSGAINVMLTSPMPATMMAENNAVNIPNLNDERGVSVGFATANLTMKILRSHRQPTNLSIHSRALTTVIISLAPKLSELIIPISIAT